MLATCRRQEIRVRCRAQTARSAPLEKMKPPLERKNVHLNASFEASSLDVKSKKMRNLEIRRAHLLDSGLGEHSGVDSGKRENDRFSRGT